MKPVVRVVWRESREEREALPVWIPPSGRSLFPDPSSEEIALEPSSLGRALTTEQSPAPLHLDHRSLIVDAQDIGRTRDLPALRQGLAGRRELPLVRQ